MPLPKFIFDYFTGGGDATSRQLTADMPPNGRLLFDHQGRPFGLSRAAVTDFSNGLPAHDSVAAGKDGVFLFVDVGTGPMITATDGGITLGSGGGGGPDNCLLIPASTVSAFKLTAASQPSFRGVANLPSILACTAFLGFNETVTDVDPSVGATDGAGFLFDPQLVVTTTNTAAGGTAVTTANKAINWILQQKVAGTDTYQDSGFPAVANADTEFRVQYNLDLKPSYYINGKLVGVKGVAGTSAIILSPVAGIQDAGAAKTMDVRRIAAGALIG